MPPERHARGRWRRNFCCAPSLSAAAAAVCCACCSPLASAGYPLVPGVGMADSNTHSFADCELGQRFGPAFVTFDRCVGAPPPPASFACRLLDVELAGGKSGCTKALCGGAHSHVGCNCTKCTLMDSDDGLGAGNFSCACGADGCACDQAKPKQCMHPGSKACTAPCPPCLTQPCNCPMGCHGESDATATHHQSYR